VVFRRINVHNTNWTGMLMKLKIISSFSSIFFKNRFLFEEQMTMKQFGRAD